MRHEGGGIRHEGLTPQRKLRTRCGQGDHRVARWFRACRARAGTIRCVSDKHLVLTKILATLGPASSDPDTIARMIAEGVRVVRINFSHGTFEAFKATLDAARAGAEKSGIPLGILGDLSGPKIRVMQVQGGTLELEVGDHVEVLDNDADACRDPGSGVVSIGTTYPQMVTEVQVGHRVLINDGAMRMLVTDVVREGEGRGAPRLICHVTQGGTLSAKKGINLPDSEIAVPSLTEWDRVCATWAVENDLDFLALSFVRSAADVQELQAHLKSLGRDHRELRSHSRLPIVAKIEKPQAIDNLDGILDAADGVMVARGDLGVEMDVAEVPVMQKRIVRQAHAVGKPVVVATQMLESMIGCASPTRAEVSDVANAILDGADATMLSGETAVGQFPVVCVSTMARTARQAEGYLTQTGLSPTQRPAPRGQVGYRTAALARGVAAIVEELDPRFVVIWSELGGGAGHLSHTRLRRPILAFSSSGRAVRQMSLLYGVHPQQMDTPGSADAFVHAVEAMLTERGWAKPGDPIVFVNGKPLGTAGVTNSIRLHYIGDVCAMPA